MTSVTFPEFSGVRCLMMPYIQGDPSSLPPEYVAYDEIVASVFFRKGDVGFLTIDESPVAAGQPHRGARAKHGRALHTEAGIWRGTYGWGSGPPSWGSRPHKVTLDRDTKILLASNLDGSCAVWNSEHEETTEDGDIGYAAHMYPYSAAVLLKAGEVREIGILTPHESLPVKEDSNRQFLRIISSGVHGREDYFTRNPLVPCVE